MTDRYDRDRIDTRYEGEAGGGSFVMGLLTGTVLGAGLGMLFAPKAGSELRNQISEQAGSLANNAQEGYRRAGEVATDLADKGRGVVDRARDAVSRGADEASRYAREATEQVKSTASTAASNFTSGSGPFTGSGGSHS